jgi:hypothetical protein
MQVMHRKRAVPRCRSTQAAAFRRPSGRLMAVWGAGRAGFVVELKFKFEAARPRRVPLFRVDLFGSGACRSYIQVQAGTLTGVGESRGPAAAAGVET